MEGAKDRAAGHVPVLLILLYALWGPDPDATRLRADVAWRAITAAAAAGNPHLEFAVHAAATSGRT